MPNTKPIPGSFPVNRESGDFGTDPGSGSRVVRMTTAPAHSNNIYCEQPYGSPDGKRFPIARSPDMFAAERQLLIADIDTLLLHLVENSVPEPAIAHAQFGEWMYYPMPDGSLRRVSMLSLAREQVMPAGSIVAPPHGHIETICPNNRYIVGYERPADQVPGTPYPDSGLTSFVVDVETGEKRTLVDGPTNINPHAQLDPTPRDGPNHRLMHQLLDRTGERLRVEVHVTDIATGERTMLPLGGEWSAESTGHMAWVGHTGRIICAVECDRENQTHDPRHKEGNLLITGPGEDNFDVFPAPDCAFWHTSVSQCGRYFVSDDFMHFKADAFNGTIGPIRIVVGNLETGKYRVLIRDVMSHGIAGSSRFEPNPYFTADSKYVIYNASPQGLTQVFAAEVPDGFLASLD